jgi:MOSC domain-containing protein YiiM
MKVISTNIGAKKTIEWKGSELTTGIYKLPVEKDILLRYRGVEGDHINNLKVHGGLDKACYAYGENYYAFWKKRYPKLAWTYGMFGENLTISDIDEDAIKIGDIYRIGEVIVQVSQPRQPCVKFAAKFGSDKLINQFIEFEHPGVYLRVIQEGKVHIGDEMIIELRNEKALSLGQVFRLLYHKQDAVNVQDAEAALFDSNLATSAKDTIRRLWKI